MSSETNKEKLSINLLKERFLECGICQEEFNEGSKTPRLLQCLHTFCSDCLRKLVKTNAIECPLCRGKYPVCSAKDVEDFPKDNTRRDLLQFVTKSDHNIICKVCEDKSVAKYRCKNCADFMCEQCKKAHRRTKFTKEHKVFRIEDLKSDPEILSGFLHEGFCTVAGHETVPLKLYCAAAECCKPICYNCAVSEHRDPKQHPVKNIINVYEEKKQNLKKNLEDVKSTRKEMLERKEMVDKETVKLQPSLSEAHEDIEREFGLCIKQLTTRRDQLKKEAKEIIEKKKSVLERQSCSYRDYIERLYTSIRFTEETLIYKDVAGLLEIEETIHKRLENLQREKIVEAPNTNAQLEFQTTKMSTEFESFCNHMGSVVSTEAYLPNTKIIIPEQVEVGKESTINIGLYTVTQKALLNKNVGLEVEITDNEGNQEKLTVCCQNEYFTVQFTPITAGVYRITVLALGRKLLLGKKEFEVSHKRQLISEDENRSAGAEGFEAQQPQKWEDKEAKVQDDVVNVLIDVQREDCCRKIMYKFQGYVLKTQEFHADGICTRCNYILDLLRRANEKGVLFQKTGGNEITWNKDIPYRKRMFFGIPMNCDDYLSELKQSLAKYGIE